MRRVGSAHPTTETHVFSRNQTQNLELQKENNDHGKI
jgi:hypothetical protein